MTKFNVCTIENDGTIAIARGMRQGRIIGRIVPGATVTRPMFVAAKLSDAWHAAVACVFDSTYDGVVSNVIGPNRDRTTISFGELDVYARASYEAARSVGLKLAIVSANPFELGAWGEDAADAIRAFAEHHGFDPVAGTCREAQWCVESLVFGLVEHRENHGVVTLPELDVRELRALLATAATSGLQTAVRKVENIGHLVDDEQGDPTVEDLMLYAELDAAKRLLAQAAEAMARVETAIARGQAARLVEQGLADAPTVGA